MTSFRSTLGTCRRAFGAVFLLLSVNAAQARAQIHGNKPTSRASGGWWVSAGINGAVLNDISDGRNNQRWQFGNDPLWQMRGSLERVHDEFTSYGVSVAYGNVDLTVRPLVLLQNDTAFAGSGAKAGGSVTSGSARSAACEISACAAKADLWSIMGQFRSGGGSKFHTMLEASAGALGVLNLKDKETKSALTTGSGSWDAMATLGGGFALPLGTGFALALVQDFGIGWHSKQELPTGTGRTWRIRSTRAYIRIAFGARN